VSFVSSVVDGSSVLEVVGVVTVDVAGDAAVAVVVEAALVDGCKVVNI
jgi:hypothetical protein